MNTKKTENCKVYCLAIQKGGVAKTTSSVAMSAALAEQGYKVLLIDNDPQANSTRAVGKYGKTSPQNSITGIMEDLIDFRLFAKDKGIFETDEQFYILPSDDSYSHFIRVVNYFIKFILIIT